jgi:hypothetical protein
VHIALDRLAAEPTRAAARQTTPPIPLRRGR